MFGVTSRVFPVPMMVAPALLNGFLAWRVPGAGGRLRAVYAAIAVATLSIMPWTLVALMPINRMLEARSAKYDVDLLKEKREGEDELVETLQDRETTHALVDQWGVRNLYRSAVSLLAGCAGLYAALV
ncbi:putative duf1772 domain containing protein [Eutypa lata UCREL1]|uniref:Putative duf1772 domain containing protein n=1 Tax=Eutypa lata (strain UCR-EL1) TaxID=1287681 RepID=M7TEJ8_EUTLA|nr:putative duf1772 domain containing protein [Eutypa lata UCREL1]